MNPRPWSKAWQPLVEAAGTALRHARGRIGWAAAVEDDAGQVNVGISVSIPDLPAASLCAEQIAVARSRLSGGRAVRRIVVVTVDANQAGPPCGRCLQILREFGADLEVRWGTVDEQRGGERIGRLLPRAFLDYRTSS